MSLFQQLRRLYRKDKFQLEDFHTEIVAQVLRNSPNVTSAWLQASGASSLGTADSIKISTQEEFPALDGHATASRPDVAIRIARGELAEMVLIESKVAAKEGPEQLQRYVDHLGAKKNVDRTALVFITRDFEPIRGLKGLGPNIIFKQMRWFQFYEFWKAHVNGDGLAAELMLFMKENKMSIRNQFSSIDTVALENFLGAKALMDETMWGEVAASFQAAYGKVSAASRAMSELAKHRRYIMYEMIGKHWDLECLLGYWLPDGAPGESVLVGFMFVTSPKSPIRKKVVAALKELARNNDGRWVASGLEDDTEWGTVTRSAPLQSFYAQSDQVVAIKRFFREVLEEGVKFKQAHPELPWDSQSVERDNKDE
jgi:hypothetical protein